VRRESASRSLPAGHTHHEIGKKLFISVRTVDTHRAHIMEAAAALDRAGQLLSAHLAGAERKLSS
jgi:DNA-binding NarL/FixJ family response regulator